LSLIAQDHLHQPQALPAPHTQPAFSTTLM